MVGFKGELTRRLHKCYPGGSGPDKSPVANELSMLIFYLNSRPAKIPKAARLLSSRAQSLSAKENRGNFVVTALIMHQIIKELYVHFSLFAEGALDVINCVVDKSRSDPSFLELGKDMFTDYNRYHNGVLFAGNATFSQNFLGVVNKFVLIAQKGSQPTRVLAIQSLASLADSPALATKIGQKSILAVIPALEVNIEHNAQAYQEVTETTKGTVPSSKKNDPAFAAVMALRELLDTPSLEQITGIVKSILQWHGNNSEEWQPRLVAYIAKWVPPQNRFIVTKTISASMAHLPPDHVKEMSQYSAYLDALLVAEESKIGLSVVDVLRQLLHLQHRLIDSPPPSVDHQSIQKLLASLRNNIGNLVNTNIYPGQTGDMILEILQKYSNTSSSTTGGGGVGGGAGAAAPVQGSVKSNNSARLSSTSSARTTTSQSYGVIINDLRVLLEILQTVTIHEHDQRKLSAALWVGTQWILTTQYPQLLALYAITFAKYLELAQPQAHPESKAESAITRQLSELARGDGLSAKNYVSIYYCLLSLVDFHGSLSRYMLPWVLEILPSTSENAPADNATNTVNDAVNDGGSVNGSINGAIGITGEVSNSALVGRVSVGLTLALAISRKTGLDEGGDRLFKLIGERVEHNMWLPGITFPPVVTVDEAVSSLGHELKFSSPKDFSAESSFAHVTTQSVLQLIDVNSTDKLTDEDKQFILSPPFSLDAPSEQEESRVSKSRVVIDPHDTFARRSSSLRSHSSSLVETQAPRVNELRRRQTDLQSLQTKQRAPEPNKRISMPPPKDDADGPQGTNADIFNIIDSVSVNMSNQDRGILTL